MKNKNSAFEKKALIEYTLFNKVEAEKQKLKQRKKQHAIDTVKTVLLTITLTLFVIVLIFLPLIV